MQYNVNTVVPSVYATIQLMFDGMQDGDSVYFPSNSTPAYYQPPTDAGWTITKNLEIFGDGIGFIGNNAGTTFKPHSANGHVFVIVAPIEYVYLHDFKVIQDAFATGSGNAIRCDTDPATKASEIRLERISTLFIGGNAFHFDGDNGDNGAINNLTMIDCQAISGGGDGLFMNNVYNGLVEHCWFSGCGGRGIYANASGVAIFQTQVENNCTNTSLNPVYDGSIRLRGCHIARVDACQFEKFNVSTAVLPALNTFVKKALVIEDCAGALVSSCYFVNLETTTSDVGIYVNVSGDGPVTILPCRFSNVYTLINIDNNAYGCVVFPQYSVRGGTAMVLPGTPNNGFFGMPQVNTLGGGNIRSGFYLPSMATIDLPATQPGGSVAFDTTRKILRAADGTKWRNNVIEVGIDVDSVPQSASIPLANLLASAPAGLYRVSVVHTVTATNTNSGASVNKLSTTIGWTDDNAVQTSSTVAAQLATFQTKGYASGSIVIQVAASTTITYLTTLTGGAIGAGRYVLRIRLEAL